MTDPEPARASRFARLQAATDRVPTKWFATIGTVLFLAGAAAFGGMNDVAAEEASALPTLVAGETHANPLFAFTVQRAVLIDRLSGTGAFPDAEKGERLLVLLVEVENRSDEARQMATYGTAVAGRSVMLAGVDRPADGIVREDDQTPTPWLQPGIPALLAFSWVVAGDAYTAGEDLTVELGDVQVQVGQLLYTGVRWGTPVTAATVSVPIEDVGAGVEDAG